MEKERNIIWINVKGLPKGQPRARAFAFKGRARMYDPGTAEGWKGSVALAVKDDLPEQPYTCPVFVRMTFFFPRPKSHYRTGKYADQLKDSAPMYHTAKPDIDNLEKSTYDALTEMGFWKDDTQVVRHVVEKRYDEGAPGACIKITLIRSIK